MDDWGWQELEPWLDARVALPIGPLFCVINGRTRGRPWTASGARAELRRTATQAGVRRRFAPHQNSKRETGTRSTVLRNCSLLPGSPQPLLEGVLPIAAVEWELRALAYQAVVLTRQPDTTRLRSFSYVRRDRPNTAASAGATRVPRTPGPRRPSAPTYAHT
jgi:hypothetical protein